MGSHVVHDRRMALFHLPLILSATALYLVPMLDLAMRSIGVPFVTWSILLAAWIFQFVRGSRLFGRARAAGWIAASICAAGLLFGLALQDPFLFLGVVVLPVGAVVYYWVGASVGKRLAR